MIHSFNVNYVRWGPAAGRPAGRQPPRGALTGGRLVPLEDRAA